MLDVRGNSNVLPKNMNGIRTTHTCELCGFEPKTKNKYREKQDHLVMKHFKEKIDKIFPHCRPYSCPSDGCEFTGKDKQALLRHYTGKHGILERYLTEALAEKGITYMPGDHGGKRKNGEHGNSKAKKAMLVHNNKINGNATSTTNTHQTQIPMLPTAPIPLGVTTVNANGTVITTNGSMNGNGHTHAINGVNKVITTATTKSNNEELRKEVEAMMASLQPSPQQPNGVTNHQNGTSNGILNGHGIANGGQKQVVLTLPSVPVSLEETQKVVQKTVTLPARVPLPTQPTSIVSTTSNVNGAVVNGHNGTVITNSLPPSSVVNLVRRTAENGHHHPEVAGKIIVTNNSSANPPPSSRPPAAVLNGNGLNLPVPEFILPTTTTSTTSTLSIPIEVITTNNVNGGTTVVTSAAPGVGVGETRVLENEEVMWGGGPTGVGSVGPAVVVEAADTVPVAYIEGSEIVYSATTLDNIDYDYTTVTGAVGIPTAITTCDGINGRFMERQLEFSAL